MGGRFGGQYITNDTVDTYTLPWGGVAVVRLLPTRLPNDPANPGVRLTPFRHSQDVNDVGDWIRCYHGVRNFGAGPDGNGVSFLINDPTDPTAAPKEESPAYVLYNAIDRAVKAKQEGRGWASLLIGGHNKGAQLSRPKPIYLANPLIMQHKEVVYNPPQGWGDAKPKIMIMSDSAGQALMNLANGIREDADPHDTDWTRVSTCGDLVGLGPGQGQYVTFYKSTEGDPRLRRQAVAQGGAQMANFGSAPAGGGGAGTGFATYCAFAEPVFQNQSADFSHLAQAIATKAIQWDQVLNFPSYEQQAHWIADKFEPDVICYAFQDFPEWIPARVAAANVARTQQAGHMMPVGGFVGGYVPPTQPAAGQPQMAGWGAAPVQPAATSLGGQAYIQTAVANAAAMAAVQQQTAAGVAVTQTAPVEAVPFLVDALAPDAAAQQLAAQQAAEHQATVAAYQQAAAQQAAAQQVAAQQLAAQQAAAQQLAAQQLAAQQAAYAQQAAAAAAQQAAAQQAAMPTGAVAANWGAPAANSAGTPQAGASMAGLAAGGIPVAVTQATVAASNAAQQPAAGFAMPTTMAPVAAPAATGQPMSRSQAALLAAQQAVQSQP